MYSYKVGGSLPHTHPTYIEREADRQLYNYLYNGQYCHVLSSRQMGKSSLKVRMIDRLKAERYICIDIDLSIVGGKGTTEDEWYGGIYDILCKEAKISIDIKDWWQNRLDISFSSQLNQFINEILLKQIQGKIVIFIDEIDSILKFDFKNSFFSLIRSCCNQRATNSAFERLTFCLIGVAIPAKLIDDPNSTPFNISQAIDLKGFSSSSNLTPLEVGLRNYCFNPKEVLKKVIYSTGGQPFLTQKICQMIQDQDSHDYISDGKEEQEVGRIIQNKIIANWESQDNPQHFKTIENEILSKKGELIQLLEDYRKILQEKKIKFDNSDRQIQLTLSGLVISDNSYLKVYNPIYKQIFDEDWINTNLKTQRPYDLKLEAWIKSDKKDTGQLLNKEDLEETLKWQQGQKLDDQDYQFISASEELVRKTTESNLKTQTKKAKKWKTIGAIGLIVVSFSFILFQQKGCFWGSQRIDEQCLLNNTFEGTSGDKNFFKNEINSFLSNGMKAFESRQYSEAESYFEQAKKNINDPIPKIYFNNAQARKKNSFFKVAVVVPITNRPSLSQEILRGVADAQDQFNQTSGINDRLLEIKIYDDQSNPLIAEKIAKKITEDKDILAVVGHYGSDSSKKALPIYEKSKVVMVASGSISSELQGDYFFRIDPIDQQLSQQLAQYAIKNLSKPNVLVLYDSNSIYSKGLYKYFKNSFEGQGGTIIETTDLKKIDHNYLIQNNIQGLVLIPSTNTIDSSIEVALKLKQLPQGKNLKLLSFNAIYESNTLCLGNALEGLVLSVPWHIDINKDGYYNEQNSTKRWGGPVSWRTAGGYDATQAIIHSLSENATRETVFEKLKTLDLSSRETSGVPLFFKKNGNSIREPVLVEVSGDTKFKPRGCQFGFKLIPESESK